MTGWLRGALLGAHHLVAEAGAEWVGAAIVCDALADRAVRRRLGVRSPATLREL